MNFQDICYHLELNLSLLEFKENDTFIVYCPALDLSGYDTTRKGARKSFEVTLDEFIRYTVNKNTFVDELKSLGWQVNKRKKRFKQPDFSKLLRSKTYLNEVVNHKEFTKVNSKYAFPDLV